MGWRLANFCGAAESRTSNTVVADDRVLLAGQVFLDEHDSVCKACVPHTPQPDAEWHGQREVSKVAESCAQQSQIQGEQNQRTECNGYVPIVAAG